MQKANTTIWKIATLSLVAILSIWIGIPQHPCFCASPEVNASCGQKEACCQSEKTNSGDSLQTESCCCAGSKVTFLPSRGLKIEPERIKLASIGYGIKEVSCLNQASEILFNRKLETRNDCLKLSKIFLLNRALLI